MFEGDWPRYLHSLTPNERERATKGFDEKKNPRKDAKNPQEGK